MNQQNIKEALASALTSTGRELRYSAAEVAQYVAARAAYLATLAGQAGFEQAMQAEQDCCRIFAGVRAVEQADAIDGKVLGIMQLGLQVLAGAAA